MLTRTLSLSLPLSVCCLSASGPLFPDQRRPSGVAAKHTGVGVVSGAGAAGDGPQRVPTHLHEGGGPFPYTHTPILPCTQSPIHTCGCVALPCCLFNLACFFLSSFFISLTCACLTFLTPQEKLFNLLLTERICPLIIKLFSPSSKYRHSPPANAASPSDKPTFALSVRLLRILSVLIREFYTSLVGPCSRRIISAYYNVHVEVVV